MLRYRKQYSMFPRPSEALPADPHAALEFLRKQPRCRDLALGLDRGAIEAVFKEITFIKGDSVRCRDHGERKWRYRIVGETFGWRPKVPVLPDDEDFHFYDLVEHVAPDYGGQPSDDDEESSDESSQSDIDDDKTTCSATEAGSVATQDGTPITPADVKPLVLVRRQIAGRFLNGFGVPKNAVGACVRFRRSKADGFGGTTRADGYCIGIISRVLNDGENRWLMVVRTGEDDPPGGHMLNLQRLSSSAMEADSEVGAALLQLPELAAAVKTHRGGAG